MGLSHTVYEINNGDFSRKSPIFPPRVLNIPAEGVPLEFGTGARSGKTRMMGQMPDGQKSFKIGLAV